jgi:type 1 glutamine amidotransferase
MNLMLWRFGAVVLSLLAIAPAQRADNELTPKEIQEGWILLFNGKDAKNWMLPNGKPLPAANVQDGCINPHQCGAGWTYFNTKFGDFVLSLDFKITKDCNSGVFFRVANPKDEVYTGFEMQVYDTGHKKDPGRNDCGAIYDCLAPSKNMMKAPGEWNHIDLTCKGASVKLVMNGAQIIDMDLDKWTEVGKNPDGSKNKFKKAIKDFDRTGFIGVQEHGNDCWYKNVKLKPLAVASTPLVRGGDQDAQAKVLVAPLKGGPAAGERKRLLLITESRTFVHDPVKRKYTLAADLDPAKLPSVPGLDLKVEKGGKGGSKIVANYSGRIDTPEGIEFKDGGKVVAKVNWCLSEETMVELGKKNGFDVICSQDARAEITPEKLKEVDAIWFYTTGELLLSETQKEALLAFVRSGKGFGGCHCATDTLYKWQAYGELIGAYFDGHPWHQKVTVLVEDKNHASTKHLGDSFVITDEIYQFRGPYDRNKLHVLMKLDLTGLKPGKRSDNDNALAWTNTYGNGRVFYTALGHRDEVWRDPRFQQHVVGGLRYMFGLEGSGQEKK